MYLLLYYLSIILYNWAVALRRDTKTWSNCFSIYDILEHISDSLNSLKHTDVLAIIINYYSWPIFLLFVLQQDDFPDDSLNC